jgi:hypothetical protein
MKDPYEVLGVRRNAGAAEIELAYRGRRTQYHPDKYQGSDAQTLQWATQQMQEVNAAYAVLSNVEERARFDAQRQQPQGKMPEEDPPRGHASSTGAGLSLRELLDRQLAPYAGFSRTYFAPGIPLKKLSSALQSYGGELRAEDVLVLIDSTIFGGAKEGAILTEQGIHVKELAAAPARWHWHALRTVMTGGTGVYINGLRVLDCPMVGAPELARVFAVVQEWVGSMPQAHSAATQESTRRSPDATPDASPTSSALQRKYLDMYRMARAELLDLCDHIEELEVQLGQELIERSNATVHFEHLEALIQDPKAAEAAWSELGKIAVLSQCAVAFDGDAAPPPVILCAERNDDSQLVGELRALLRLLVRAREDLRREGRARTAQFFRR